MTQPYDVLFASKQYQHWLTARKDKAMLATYNQAQAMVREVMEELRDSVCADDGLAIANALPALPRGVMLEGRRLGGPKSAVASSADFHRNLVARLGAHQPPPVELAGAAFAVWREELPPAAARVVASKLPEALKPLWTA